MYRLSWTATAIALAFLLSACFGNGDDDDDDSTPDVHCTDPINEVSYPSDADVLADVAYFIESDGRTTVEGTEVFEYDKERTEDEHRLQVIHMVVEAEEIAMAQITNRDGDYVLDSVRYDPPIPVMRNPPVDGNSWTAEGQAIPDEGEATPFDVTVQVTGPECIGTYMTAYKAWKHTVTMPGDAGPTHTWYVEGLGVIRVMREGLDQEGTPAYSDALMEREQVSTTPVNDYMHTVGGEAIDYVEVVLPEA